MKENAGIDVEKQRIWRSHVGYNLCSSHRHCNAINLNDSIFEVKKWWCFSLSQFSLARIYFQEFYYISYSFGKTFHNNTRKLRHEGIKLLQFMRKLNNDPEGKKVENKNFKATRR